MKIQEFDSFGPWIQEIKDIEDIPRLFKAYVTKIDDSILMLKVPRDIERRKADPNMNLYDYLLCLYNEHLLILKRVEESVEVKDIKFEDLAAVRKSNSLLNGDVTFYLSNEEISINYNTSSNVIINKFLKLIRERYTENNLLKINEFPHNSKVKDLEYLYVDMLEDFASDEDKFKLLAVQPTIKAISRRTGKIAKIIDSINIFKENMLQNTMFLTNNKELLIVTRVKSFTRPKVRIYGYDFTYIPLSNISSFRIDTNSDYENICPFYVEIGSHTFKYYFENNNNQKEYLLCLMQA